MNVEVITSASLFLVGLFLLILASNYLIQASEKLSILFKLTPFFIGLVLIAFGTSAPELGVGVIAAIKNQKDIALGNVVGSNIANIGLILGLCGLLKPIKITSSIFRRELPILILVTLLFYILSLDLVLSRRDGIILLILFIIFCILSYQGARKEYRAQTSNFIFKGIFKKTHSRTLLFIIFLLSLAILLQGANMMVNAGVKLALIFHISPWVIALTFFAVGTSLPELATSLAGIMKKLPGISVGNIIGSNIFNILLILGIVSLIRPIPISGRILSFEMPALLIFSILLPVFMRTKYTISRKESLLFFSGYLIFLFLLFRK